MITLTGHVAVPLPPEGAFRLFTPVGERDWVSGWDPHFPVPVDDDSAPGTVFVTEAGAAPGAEHPATTWMVVDREPGRRIRYARVVPELHAGTVTVALDGAGDHSDVTVTYELTPLSPGGAERLDAFAAGYPAFLKSWETAISRALRPRS